MKITVEILKWDEYNPRKDIKSMPWFKLSSDIGFSETLFGLSAEIKWFWVFTLSACARNISAHLLKTGGVLPDCPGLLSTTTEYLSHHSGVKEDLIIEIFKEFEVRDLVKINPPSKKNDHERDPDESVRVQNGVKVFTNESERIRALEEEENREEKNRIEENRASAPILLSSFVDKEILKAVSIEVQTSWILKYPSEKYLKLQFNEISSWLKAKRKRPMKKPMDVFVGEWLESNWSTFVSRAQKTNPVIDANASAKASFLLEELTRHGADSPAYNEHDIEVISRLGDLKQIRECTPTEKQKIHREIKEIYISIMNSS